MARTRAQLAAQKGRVSSAPKSQGKPPVGIQKRRNSHRAVTTRLQERLAPQHIDTGETPQSRIEDISCQQEKRGTKRLSDAHNRELEPSQKRLCPYINSHVPEDNSWRPKHRHCDSRRPTDAVGFWVQEGKWPHEHIEHKMEHLLARKKSLYSLTRKRANSASSSTSSDQRPREEKSAPYRDARYELLLQTKGTYMDISDLDIAHSSKRLIDNFLRDEQPVPRETIFDDSVFVDACRNLRGKNEARVVQDISRLLVPSAEALALYDKKLKHLTESVNEGWSNSIPVTGTRPQPDYSVGFSRESFTGDQLAKLSPFVGDFIGGDQSFFMSTYYMYFPFLTCEVKCGTAALDVADRQNAHSMTIALRAVTELFRAVKRENEVHRQILAFSISHDHRSVRIYGHYPVLDGEDTKYYRHPIREFSFTELDGKEKWTAYRFTKNIYDTWMPLHLKRLCTAVDTLPSDLDFDSASLQTTGLSQGLESHHVSLSDADSISLHGERDTRSISAKQASVTPSTSFTDLGVVKRRKAKK